MGPLYESVVINILWNATGTMKSAFLGQYHLGYRTSATACDGRPSKNIRISRTVISTP